MKKVALGFGALALASAPVMAQSVRTAAPAGDESELGGGGAGIYAAGFIAAVVAIAVIAVVNDDDDDDPVSP